MSNSLIGPALLADIRRTVDVVRAKGGAEGVFAIPTRFETRRGEDILSKTTATWAIGTSQELCVYAGDPPDETATSQTVTAWNKFSEIPAGKWVFLSRANGHWYVVAAECVPPEEPSPP